MTLTKRPDSKKFIPSEHFNICLIDGLNKEQISKKYRKQEVTNRKNCYYIFKFIYHLKIEHNIGLVEYCEKYLGIDWPKCPIRHIKVGYKTNGNGVLINVFSRGGVTKETSPKFKLFCERISKERTGDGNPAYGRIPWNSGLDNSDPRIKAIAEKRTGAVTSEESKKKQSESAKKRKIHGHTGIKHSKESKNKMREATAKLWANGTFSKTTSIHIKMREFLSTLKLVEKPQEEYQVKYYSLDFALPEHKIGIECQGTYYHIDPRIYPNGPKDKIQRRNFGRDIAKKKYLSDRGWTIIECWETEINDNSFKEYLVDKIKELGLIC